MPDENGGVRDPGDLGRRIAQRRQELGISSAEIALRAGMAPGYVEYLEHQPTGVTEGELLRLANALDTTVRALLGAGIDAPRASMTPLTIRELIELDHGQSRALLGTHGVGRVGLFTASGPLIVPVNYAVVDDTIVFRTAANTILAAETAEGGTQVAFEVDHVDDANRQGWAVLVTGEARTVTDPDELRYFADRAHIQPWAGGQRDICVCVEAQRITGRRILTH